MIAIDGALLADLVCPVTRTPLTLSAAGDSLVSAAAGLAFPICDGVPVLLVEAAKPLASPGDQIIIP